MPKNKSSDIVKRLFYNPQLSYDKNFQKGPFGTFADGKKYKQKGKPKYQIFGQKIFLPFGIPAGPLINGNYVKGALDKGWDLVVYKTVRSVKYKSHKLPNVIQLDLKGDLTLEMAERGIKAIKTFRDPLVVTNSFGVPSPDPAFWQEDLAKAALHAREGQVVIGSFQGTKREGQDHTDFIKDFIKTAKLVKETGVKVIEVNLSCPNEGHSNLVCFDIDTSVRIVGGVKNVIGNTPLVIKIAHFWDKDRLSQLVKEVGGVVQGISAINTIPAKVITHKGDPALGIGREMAGVCGSPIKWAGLEMTKRLKDLRSELGMDFRIIGVGGVTIPQDYHEYKEAGADAVMSATGAMWNPFLAQEIKGVSPHN